MRARLLTIVVMSLALGCSAGGGADKVNLGSGASGGSLNLGGGSSGPKGGSAGSLSIDPTGGSAPAASGPCEGGGWRCQVPDCTGQDPTSIRATVYDPAGVT